MKIVLFFLTAALLFGGIYYALPEKKTDECENVFSSSVYPAYQKQLLKAAQETNAPDALVAILESQPPSRNTHEQFVLLLRKLAKESLRGERNQALGRFVQDLYLHVDLLKESEAFLYAYIPKPSGALLTYLPEALQELRKNNHFTSLQTLPKIDDPFLNGNLPAYQFMINGAEVFRMAQPVVDSFFYQRLVGEDLIHPEFRLFLRAQAPQTHLYVNLMKRSGFEGRATHEIEKLELDEMNLSVVTLDKNSPFYWQEDSFSQSESSFAFKTLFLKLLTEGNGAYYWSKNLAPGDWKMALASQIENVHAAYFDKKSQLTKSERQDFIELTYLAILDELLLRLSPKTVNLTCRQAMDRGPSLALLWLWKHQPGIDVQAEAALFLAPPLLIHNRPSHTSRLHRLLSAAKYLYPKK